MFGLYTHYIVTNDSLKNDLCTYDTNKIVCTGSNSDHQKDPCSKLFSIIIVFVLKIVSEYDQEIPQSQIADNPVAPRGRAAQPSRDTWKTN